MARMKSTAFYDRRAEAERAADELARRLGLDRALVRVHAAPGGAGADEEGGLLDWLARIWRPEADFLPPEDRELLGEGLRRGGAVLSAEIQEGDLARAERVLEAHGAVDLAARALAWRGDAPAREGTAAAGPRVRSYPWDAPTTGAPTGPAGPPRV
ncbi:hypothetical protein [Caldovatus aquaticus]|uniref:Uncharacterized protein n=1 Tax=Caldovatus aquaticus TaxID=2865671 RepID=A0ABS7F844_9PROT|nr:hypothetical protein [Caldovatus aquaticus]MBW8270996.1 hypothetical protein [Caldovatus aquaticus]